MANETSTWRKFFENAGLPPKISSKYASLFVEHRIQRNMLPDLTKSILNEVGITAVGDVLAILKEAKIVANRDEVEAKDIKQKVAMSNDTFPVPIKPKVTVPSKPTAPVKRTSETVPLAKRPRIQSAPDHDVEYQVKMPAGTTERSREIMKKAATVQRKVTTSNQSKSVFDRLGTVVQSDQSDYEEEDARSTLARLRKSVSFATGTKESSPEVTSTTDEYFGKMESDRMGRKLSALQRLGMKASNELVTVDSEGRRMLVAKRTVGSTKKSIFDRLG